MTPATETATPAKARRAPRKSTTRTATTRKAEVRHVPSADFESELYIDPRTIPAGFAYAWVREAILNQPDATNVARRMRLGYRPVPADRHPERMVPPLPGAPVDTTNIIRHGGLILMECPIKDVIARRRKKDQENLEIAQGINWQLGEGGLNEETKLVRKNETSIEEVRQTFKE